VHGSWRGSALFVSFLLDVLRLGPEIGATIAASVEVSRPLVISRSHMSMALTIRKISIQNESNGRSEIS
jgi:hypothetical protein